MKTTAPAIQEDCPLCQSVCQQVVHGHTMRFGRRTIGLDGLRKWVCGECGFEFNDETQSAHNLQIIEEATRSHQGATTPGMLRKLRRHWGLTQATASRIFGAGPSSFAKWESGQSRMSQPSALLIQAATHVPGVMTYLAALARLPLRPHTETIWHRALMQAQRQSAYQALSVHLDMDSLRTSGQPSPSPDLARYLKVAANAQQIRWETPSISGTDERDAA